MAEGRPWWMDDPEIVALTERALAEIENADELPATDEPDPVLAESEALRSRYRSAVFAAREAGLTWAEIGRRLGVSRQQLHRKFGGWC